MPKKIAVSASDRYLNLRNGNFSYLRRIPAEVGPLDSRWPRIKISLKTTDLAEARLKRDVLEDADNQFWNDLLLGGNQNDAMARHKMLVARARRLGFTYRHLPSILKEESGADIWARLQALHNVKPASDDATAILGGEEKPKVKVSDAFKVYLKEIAAHELVGKSEKQKKTWLKVKTRAVNNFKLLCGDKYLDEISREDARIHYNYWLERIFPSDGSNPTAKADTGNRDLGNMRVLLRDYYKFTEGEERPTPFDSFWFKKGQKKKRLSFATKWIRDVFLNSDALATLNAEARAIFMICIETGARPSEICNLTADMIHLEDDVPYISVEPRLDPDDPREVKTESSIRDIPLVGVALAAMKKYPKGFPRYRNKEDGLSQVINRCLRRPGNTPTKEHTLYCLRHSFEDRMKDAKLDSELRMALMGHTNSRPQYGDGGSLKWKRDGLKKIMLPFDCAVV